MPCQARLDAPGTLRHAVDLGTKGGTIVTSPEDRGDFPARRGSEAGCGAGAGVAGLNRHLRR